jgi:hypothetical protein
LAGLLGPGNYVSLNGTLDLDSITGTRPDLLPKSVFALLALVGVVSVLMLVLAAVPASLNALARVRDEGLSPPASPPLALVSLAAVGFFLTCPLPALVNPFSFDRYLLPVIPLAGILALHAGRGVATTRGVRIISSAALVALAVFGFMYAANSASFDGTKWSVADRAATFAGSPLRVVGEFEWRNYHVTKAKVSAQQLRREPRCVVLKAEAHHPTGKRLVYAEPVWGPRGTQVWIVARQQRPC